MNRNRALKRAAAIGLSITLAAGPAIYYVPGMIHAAGKNIEAQEKPEEKNTAKTGTKKAEASASKEGQISKQESVYVNLDASGKKKKITVTDWIKNAGAAGSIEDISKLSGIANIKGDEAFTQKGENLTWTSEGEDIYYQGESSEELPVTMDITYTLDGKELSPEELLGKSGRLSIKITYTNHAKEGDVYVPFVMITGMILPTEHFNNVEIDNGRIMSDADKNIVAGIALPGLKESLNLPDSMDADIDIPSSVTITADTTDFQMGPAFTLASSELLNDIDVDNMDSYDELKDSMEELKDASKELTDGSKDLAEGVGTLKEKTGDFTSGMNTLSTGAAKLSDGAGSLEDGVKSYTEGADSLVNGIHTLAKAIKNLPAKLIELAEGLSSAKDGAGKLAESTGALETGMEAVNGGIDTVNATLTQVSGLLSQSEGAQNDPQIAAALKAINALVETTGEGGDLKSGADGVENGLGQLKAGQESLSEGIKVMEGGVASLAGNGEEMSSLTKALEQLNQGGTDLSKSSKSLVNGAKSVANGAKELKEGAGRLNDGTSALSDGIKELYDGSVKLKDGMKEFNEDGILKLYDTINEDLDQVMVRLEAISNAGKNYKSFAGINKDMNGTVRFIMETEEIK